jgi:hypothetical protein
VIDLIDLIIESHLIQWKRRAWAAAILLQNFEADFSYWAGLNITEANHVLFLDRWYNPMVHEQAMDRAHRIGQTKDVSVSFLDANMSLDEVMAHINRQVKALTYLWMRPILGVEMSACTLDADTTKPFRSVKADNASVILADGSEIGGAGGGGTPTFKQLSGFVLTALKSIRAQRLAHFAASPDVPCPPGNVPDGGLDQDPDFGTDSKGKAKRKGKAAASRAEDDDSSNQAGNPGPDIFRPQDVKSQHSGPGPARPPGGKEDISLYEEGRQGQGGNSGQKTSEVIDMTHDADSDCEVLYLSTTCQDSD